MKILRKEDEFLITFTGKRFHPFAPTVDEIDILDIAHGLSLECRFGNQCREFYSVAQHSVLMARYAVTEFKQLALMHDAPEA